MLNPCRMDRCEPSGRRANRAVGRALLSRAGLLAVAGRLALAAISLLGPASIARAQEDGGCVYDRRVYADGTEMCQGGQRMRCEEGAWGEIGLCDDNEPPPEPVTSGGDRDARDMGR